MSDVQVTHTPPMVAPTVSGENETVVLENLEKLPKDGSNPEGKHHHHLREVVCDKGRDSIVMEPFMLGHEKVFDRRERYVRSKDKDEKGRAIFRMENAS